MEWLEVVNIGIGIVISLTLFLGIGWKAWASLTIIINGVGDRLSKTELDVTKIETGLNALRGELRSERDLLMSTIHSNEKNATARHTDIRVQVARIEERLDIERLVKTIISEVREQK